MVVQSSLDRDKDRNRRFLKHLGFSRSVAKSDICQVTHSDSVLRSVTSSNYFNGSFFASYLDAKQRPVVQQLEGSIVSTRILCNNLNIFQ